MNIKLIIIFFILLTNSFSEEVKQNTYIDFGIRGQLYEIQEKSFKEDIAERLQNIDYAYWEKELLNSANESLIISSNIPNCEEDKNYIYDPTFEIDEDITIPYINKTIYKKGYKYNPLKENNIQFKKYQIFINADDVYQFNLVLKYADIADIFVVKGDYKNLLDYEIEGYVFRDEIEGKSFKINCLPTIFAQNKDVFNVKEYKLNENVSKKESEVVDE
ncbi:hypothetical protein ACNSOL_12030 (plasmid) [Aliarcobacter lanthieri]|uniref:hypothetical protein n=1 Tax=Aliarcobacter lanthieri TaxID=1355374 RepID=UPI003AACDBA7